MSRLIAAYGEALWDLLPTGPVLGGAPLNFAYRCTTLGDRGLIISRVGEDSLGRDALTQMRRLGMDTRAVQRDGEHPTGTVWVDLSDPQAPRYTIVADTAYDYIAPDPELFQIVRDSACLCFGTLIQRSPVAANTLKLLLREFGGSHRLLDVNLRPDCYSPESIRWSVRQASLLKMNDDELPEVAEAMGVGRSRRTPEGGVGEIPRLARELLAAGELSVCVVTLGARGSFAVSNDGQELYLPGYRVETVDSCGAGDAFSAAFLHALVEGASLEEACRAGNALGAMVAGADGATQPVGPEELADFLREPPPRVIEAALRRWLPEGRRG